MRMGIAKIFVPNNKVLKNKGKQMSKKEFKVGQFICDEGDHSMGIEIEAIKDNGKLSCLFPYGIHANEFRSVKIDPDGVELWNWPEVKVFLDFDGTVVEHNHPRIGLINEGCWEVIDKLQKAGHKIILHTMRVHFNDNTFQEAHDWLAEQFKIRNLQPFTYVREKVQNLYFSMGRTVVTKILIIDDSATNTPMKRIGSGASFGVDWKALDEIFELSGIYNRNK